MLSRIYQLYQKIFNGGDPVLIKKFFLVAMVCLTLLASAHTREAMAERKLSLCLVEGRVAIERISLQDKDIAAIGSFLMILNTHQETWALEDSRTLIVDMAKLSEAISKHENIKYLSPAILKIAKQLNHRKVLIIDIMTSPYITTHLIGSGSYHSQATTPLSGWTLGPGTISQSYSWTFTWSFSYGGSGAGLPYLAVNPQYGYSTTSSYVWPVPAGQRGRVTRTDYYFHTWASWHEYYWDDPDIPGLYVQYYLGQFSGASKKHTDRIHAAEYETWP